MSLIFRSGKMWTGISRSPCAAGEMGCYIRLGWWRRFSDEDHRSVDNALRKMQLGELADRQISALSGGQQQRAFLWRVHWPRTRTCSFSTSPSPASTKQSQQKLGETHQGDRTAGKPGDRLPPRPEKCAGLFRPGDFSQRRIDRAWATPARFLPRRISRRLSQPPHFPECTHELAL